VNGDRRRTRSDARNARGSELMRCPRCGTENREGSNFCRYCSFNLAAEGTKPDSGYIPSVPPPDATSFKQYYDPQAAEAPPAQPERYRQPTPFPGKYVHGQTPCPRCGSMSVNKGATPVWAILLAVILVPFTCFLSLFFLLIRDPNRCLNCGGEFR
jgi:ribosomal protein L37AE/L43A